MAIEFDVNGILTGKWIRSTILRMHKIHLKPEEQAQENVVMEFPINNFIKNVGGRTEVPNEPL